MRKREVGGMGEREGGAEQWGTEQEGLRSAMGKSRWDREDKAG